MSLLCHIKSNHQTSGAKNVECSANILRLQGNCITGYMIFSEVLMEHTRPTEDHLSADDSQDNDCKVPTLPKITAQKAASCLFNYFQLGEPSAANTPTPAYFRSISASFLISPRIHNVNVCPPLHTPHKTWHAVIIKTCGALPCCNAQNLVYIYLLNSGEL